METTKRSKIIMMSFPILVVIGNAMAQDWPQWRGANRDGKVTGFSVPQTWPAALTQKWKITVGAGDATPALVGGKLFVFARQGGEEVVLCLQAADGKEIWRDTYETPAIPGGPAASHPGPRSSPTVAEGKVVTLGLNGVVSCLDAATGKMLWRKDEYPKTVPQFFTATSPLVVDGMVITQLGTKGNGAIMAFDIANGNVKWKWDGEGPEYASPALLTADGVKQVVTMTEKSVVGVAAADGKLLWQVAFAPEGRSASNNATPIIDGSIVYFTGNARATKAVKIEKTADGFAARELWTNDQNRGHFSTPVLKNGMLYGLNDRGNFFCIDANTGQTAWTDAANMDRFGAILDAGSVLAALPSKSEMYIFKPDPRQYSQVAKYKVADTGTFAHPILSGKNIYIKDTESLSLWTVE